MLRRRFVCSSRSMCPASVLQESCCSGPNTKGGKGALKLVCFEHRPCGDKAKHQANAHRDDIGSPEVPATFRQAVGTVSGPNQLVKVNKFDRESAAQTPQTRLQPAHPGGDDTPDNLTTSARPGPCRRVRADVVEAVCMSGPGKAIRSEGQARSQLAEPVPGWPAW
jgi:hypothetical protein